MGSGGWLESKMSQMIAVSIVSHGHGEMVSSLVETLLACPEVAQILLTLNIPESFAFQADGRVMVIRNESPKGFGSNHNSAFSCCRESFFCLVNPDIEFKINPFPGLLQALTESDAALIAPLILSPQGTVEDSCRRFPNVRRIMAKILTNADGSYGLIPGQAAFFPEWVAGMFMLFRSADFLNLGGFDETFFLYYEDVDICARAWKKGMKVVVLPSVAVIHDAQRTSRRNMRYLRWHLASMARYFAKHWGRLPTVPKRA